MKWRDCLNIFVFKIEFRSFYNRCLFPQSRSIQIPYSKTLKMNRPKVGAIHALNDVVQQSSRKECMLELPILGQDWSRLRFRHQRNTLRKGWANPIKNETEIYQPRASFGEPGYVMTCWQSGKEMMKRINRTSSVPFSILPM